MTGLRRTAVRVLCALLLLTLLPCAAGADPEVTDVLEGTRPMLVNRNWMIPEDLVPADLVLLSEVLSPSLVKLKKKDLMAVREAAEALEALLEAAKADGVTNWQVGTAYRSWKDQETVLENKIKEYRKRNSGWSRSRAKSAALKSVAEPGCSEHQLGLAFDMNVPGKSFKGTKQCKWLHEHCWEYGFILRYQEGKEDITGYIAEAWHIRYVGLAHSLKIRDLGMCLEEYLESLPEVTESDWVVEDIPLDDLLGA